jgi:hypothetical protein
LEPFSYWVRIRSDQTTPGMYTTLAFDVMDETIYVYCPDTEATCSDSGRVGNRSKPFQSISRAISEAQVLEYSTIKVAARGNNTDYLDSISLPSGISLLGGYTSDFTDAHRDMTTHPTRITNYDNSAMVLSNIISDTLIEGFFIQAADGPISFGLNIANADQHLTIQHCHIVGGNSTIRSHGIALTNSGDLPSNGPRIRNNIIEAGDTIQTSGGWNAGPASSYGMYIHNSSGIIQDNIIRSGDSSAAYDSCWSIGLYFSGERNAFNILNNTIKTGTVENSSTDKWCSNEVINIEIQEGDFRIEGNTLNQGSIHVYSSNDSMFYEGIYAMYTGSLIIHQNTLSQSEAQHDGTKSLDVNGLDIKVDGAIITENTLTTALVPFTAPAGYTQVTGIQMRCDDFEIRDGNTILAQAATLGGGTENFQGFGISVVSDSDSGLIQGNTIQSCPVTAGTGAIHVYSIGINLEGTNHTVENNTIVNGSISIPTGSTSTGRGYGMHVEGNGHTIQGNSITALPISITDADATIVNVGLKIQDTDATTLVLDNTIENSSLSQGSGIMDVWSEGIYMVDADAQIVSNTIRAKDILDGTGSGDRDTMGVEVFGGSPILKNNVIECGIGDYCYGVDLDGEGNPIVTNNTIRSGVADIYSIGIHLRTGTPVVANNILFTDDTTDTWCFSEASGGDNPASFESNLLFNCVTGLYWDNGGGDRTLIAEVNSHTTTNQIAGTVSGNLTVANLGDVFFMGSNDYHLTSSTPVSITQGGVAAHLASCAGGTASCGSVILDRDLASRTVFYSIGAYEWD